jgi:hypothetical protein
VRIQSIQIRSQDNPQDDDARLISTLPPGSNRTTLQKLSWTHKYAIHSTSDIVQRRTCRTPIKSMPCHSGILAPDGIDSQTLCVRLDLLGCQPESRVEHVRSQDCALSARPDRRIYKDMRRGYLLKSSDMKSICTTSTISSSSTSGKTDCTKSL